MKYRWIHYVWICMWDTGIDIQSHLKCFWNAICKFNVHLRVVSTSCKCCSWFASASIVSRSSTATAATSLSALDSTWKNTFQYFRDVFLRLDGGALAEGQLLQCSGSECTGHVVSSQRAILYVHCRAIGRLFGRECLLDGPSSGC